MELFSFRAARENCGTRPDIWFGKVDLSKRKIWWLKRYGWPYVETLLQVVRALLNWKIPEDVNTFNLYDMNINYFNSGIKPQAHQRKSSASIIV